MNTFAMVITVVGTGLCFIPGLYGWIGIAMAVTGTIIGITGITSVKTSNGNLGMDVASWVYGFMGLSSGLGFQIKYAAGSLDFLLVPLDLQSAAAATSVIIPLFITVQILARKKLRIAGIITATLLYFTMSATAWTALTIADRSGIHLPFV